MLPESELKKQLQSMVGEKFAVLATADLTPLVEAMTAHIGSTDFELRDDLIYSAFAAWVMQDVLTAEQLRGLLNATLDDRHIFYRVGESGTDSVFTRTFSMLLLPVILFAHQRRPYLTSAEIQTIKQKILRYISLERDYRGFVEEKGWAHAIAHTADALESLAHCQEVGVTDLIDLLNAIKQLAGISEQVLTHEEDERLSIAVSALVKRGVLETADWQQWLDDCVAVVEEPRPVPQSVFSRTNIKNLLRSLYFRLNRMVAAEQLPQAETAVLIGRLSHTINQVTRF